MSVVRKCLLIVGLGSAAVTALGQGPAVDFTSEPAVRHELAAMRQQCLAVESRHGRLCVQRCERATDQLGDGFTALRGKTVWTNCRKSFEQVFGTGARIDPASLPADAAIGGPPRDAVPQAAAVADLLVFRPFVLPVPQSETMTAFDRGGYLAQCTAHVVTQGVGSAAAADYCRCTSGFAGQWWGWHAAGRVLRDADFHRYTQVHRQCVSEIWAPPMTELDLERRCRRAMADEGFSAADQAAFCPCLGGGMVDWWYDVQAAGRRNFSVSHLRALQDSQYRCVAEADLSDTPVFLPAFGENFYRRRD